VFAAGDVATAWHPWYGARVHVEHWDNAKRQGRTAAAAMLGDAKAYDRLPYFYSDQYELGMEYTGLADAGDRVVFRGDPAGGEFVAFWLRDGAVTAGMNVNVWDVAADIEKLIRTRRRVDPAQLADPSCSLAQLVAQ
jgi:3-phenylpropionate/trans-cinnamate dioxygenase ferredoxin reductase subunit